MSTVIIGAGVILLIVAFVYYYYKKQSNIGAIPQIDDYVPPTPSTLKPKKKETAKKEVCNPEVLDNFCILTCCLGKV